MQKNLRGNMAFGQAFIQRDLTIKQREKETAAGAATETKEGQRRNRSDNNTGQDSGQKKEGDVCLRFLYTNANSLYNKMPELLDKIADEKYDLMGITETWATPAS